LGQPFFPWAGVFSALGDGVSVAAGDSLGVGVGDAFLRFDFVFGVGLGDGVGEAFSCSGEVVGDGLGVDFFGVRFRCFRAGVGVGARIFLIFVPNDSSALPEATIVPKQIEAIRKLRRIVLIAGNKISARAPEGLLCSVECRLRDFREGSSRSASARDNRGVRVPSAVSRYRGWPGTPRQSGCCRPRG